MTAISVVPADDIEKIVGVPRWFHEHIGRIRADDGSFFILHSHECVDSTPDLTDCPFTKTLEEHGWQAGIWQKYGHQPVVLDDDRTYGLAAAFPLEPWPYLPPQR